VRAALVVAAAFALGAGGYGASSAVSRATAPPVVVRVVARDFSYSLSRKAVPVGRVRFVLVNRGQVQHDLAIAGRRTAIVNPGRSAMLEVNFRRAGSYAYRCTVAGHAALGMKGVLTVGKPAPKPKPPSTTTTATTPAPTTGQASGLRLTKIGSFERPVFVAAPRGDPRRLFVIEQRGTIREVLDGEPRLAPFLDITDKVEEVSERGLFSIAFAPDFLKSGLFYVDYSDRTGNGNVNVVEYRRAESNPEIADPDSARRVLYIEKPWENHNAGMLQFGPDGYLYVAVGDGDSGVLHDPGAFAQTLDDLLGNILRIEPRRAATDLPYSIPETNPFAGKAEARGEVWDYGLRNPWRFWIDSVTGDLYVGDPGEGGNEELDYVQGNQGGVNFGWPCFQASARFDSTRSCPGAVPPIYEYDHRGGRCAVIGGVVVRDPRLVDLGGRYLFGDYCDGKVRSLEVVDGKAVDVRDLGVTVPALSSFGVDGRGRVYLVSTEGGVYRLDPAPVG
jgi:glucose/arabinose dehydrogenase